MLPEENVVVWPVLEMANFPAVPTFIVAVVIVVAAEELMVNVAAAPTLSVLETKVVTAVPVTEPVTPAPILITEPVVALRVAKVIEAS